MAVVLGVILLGIVAFLVWRFKHTLDWSTRTLKGHEATFDLGETREVTYRAEAKRSRVLDPLDISVVVRCEEEVYYNHGTDRHRRADDLYVERVAITRHPDDTAVVITCSVFVPPDLPPSLDLSENNVNWKLDFKLDPATGVQLTESFDLQVAPRVRAPGSEPSVIQQRPWDDGSSPLPPTPGNLYE
jgi:hypothetical protein